MPDADTNSPALPRPRGEISELVIELIQDAPRPSSRSSLDSAAWSARELAQVVPRPLADDDFQVALYTLYGLHYRSFAGVDADWEWDPGILAIRAALEAVFANALDAEVPHIEAVDPERVGEELFNLEAADDAPSLSRFLERESSIEQFREFVIHRSAYQLKEADPHSWAIPRLTAAPKAALLEVQFDEYGSGRPERMHSRLFANSMQAMGLDAREDVHVDRLPGSTLATVNLMSWFGLHRKNRGALVGHLAMFEMSSSKPNRAYGNGLRRLGLGTDATAFFDEHVEADAVHENIAAYDMAGGLSRQEPELARDVIFGATALLHLEAAFANRLLESWKRESSSLVQPPPGRARSSTPPVALNPACL